MSRLNKKARRSVTSKPPASTARPWRAGDGPSPRGSTAASMVQPGSAGKVRTLTDAPGWRRPAGEHGRTGSRRGIAESQRDAALVRQRGTEYLAGIKDPHHPTRKRLRSGHGIARNCGPGINGTDLDEYRQLLDHRVELTWGRHDGPVLSQQGDHRASRREARSCRVGKGLAKAEAQ